MKFSIFEGSTEEFEKVYPLFKPEPQSVVVNTDLQENGASDPIGDTTEEPPKKQPAKALTEKAAMNFLTRRPLSQYQKAILKSVYEAGDTGTTNSQMAKRIGCDVASVKAAMRTFGRRVAHTDGWPDGLSAFKQQWEEDQNRYHLHSAVRSVIESGAVKL